jgi:hypothetical protein
MGLSEYSLPVVWLISTSFSMSTVMSWPVASSSHSRTSVSTGYSSPVEMQLRKKMRA